MSSEEKAKKKWIVHVKIDKSIDDSLRTQKDKDSHQKTKRQCDRMESVYDQFSHLKETV